MDITASGFFGARTSDTARDATAQHDPYAEGYDAYSSIAGSKSNPYGPEDRRYQLWESGFTNAQLDWSL